MSADRRKREGHTSDDRGFNRYRARGHREKEDDRGRDRMDRGDKRRRRRRESSDSRERDASRSRRTKGERERDGDDDRGGGGGGGFRPAPWMNNAGQRPGENAAAPVDNTTRPEIQICSMRWDDKQVMDARVGGLVPHITESSLSNRFGQKNEERDEETGKLQHLATLQELGVPVRILYPQLDELWTEYGIKVVMPEALYTIEESAQRQYPERDREREQIIENKWPELPNWTWGKPLSQEHMNNAASQVLLLALVPASLNNEEALKGHFQKFGAVSQVITRINFRPAPKYEKQGLAIVEMGNTSAATLAHRSHAPVCGNRFVKVFFAPEEVKKKVVKIGLNLVMQARQAQLAKLEEKESKRKADVETLTAVKTRVQDLKDMEEMLKEQLKTAGEEQAVVFRKQIESTKKLYHEALAEQLELMEQAKSNLVKPGYRPKSFFPGANTYDARTAVFRLPMLPLPWQKSPAKLRKAMERYGEVLACCVGKKPLQGYVRFKQRRQAQCAVSALQEREHRPFWLDKWETEWPQSDNIVEEMPDEEPPRPPVATGPPKDDDEALIDEELGLQEINQEMIPVAKEDEMGEEE